MITLAADIGGSRIKPGVEPDGVRLEPARSERPWVERLPGLAAEKLSPPAAA